jgi:bifunctional non-homologous end joining protein LigD
MSPITTDTLPAGSDWGYQLKWDGYRLIVSVEDGQAKLFSKHMLPQNGKYPEIEAACSRLEGTLVLDGEAVVLDPDTGRPSFQKLQQRSKPGASGSLRQLPVQYIVFDVLQIGDQDVRGLPFTERNRRLRELAAGWEAPLHTTDIFPDGPLLWDWVVSNGWEGVVCKRLSSRYREGKEHRDWLKRKRAPEFDVEIVGILWKEGRVSSMVMRENGAYFGRVSSGLNGVLKEKLRVLGDSDRSLCPFPEWPEGLKGTEVRWLRQPIGARVTGSEQTDDGVLRHPKLLMLEI